MQLVLNFAGDTKGSEVRLMERFRILLLDTQNSCKQNFEELQWFPTNLANVVDSRPFA